ncbi:hypothetical protein PPYR_05518 [Photinus pyralis]|uniref:Uncharacterized protein n=1 Tax=Photinus pyralis TaxID=7054 RepID=A0A1Y1K9Y7_PHOPY|nr:uncharacterized protein LOC116165933 [Photinus pyralis]KAB0801164.1 hypothetical protein PPYR_05518 [Photinus pyralis]
MRVLNHTSKKIWNPGVIIIFIAIIGTASAQEDSLQSALNAVNRRQRNLSPDYKNFYTEGGLGRYYPLDDKDELAFLKPESERHETDMPDYEKGNEFNGRNRFISSFRERIDQSGDSGKDAFEDSFLNRLGVESEKDDNDDLLDVIHRRYQKYYGRYPEFYEGSAQEVRKRGDYSEYYPTLTSLGYGSVGLRKRSRYEPNDYYLNYAPSDELLNGIPDDKIERLLNYYKWNRNPYLKNTKSNKLSSWYSVEKRFPLSKRSNPPPQEHKTSHDKTTRVLSSTDPKVAKELNSIFGNSKSSSENKSEKNDKPTNTVEKETLKKELNVSDTKNTSRKKETAKNEPVSTAENGETLQIKKKSIDWSDYFGYDRKKKSKDDMGNEWLMERYHKAIAMATKRNLDKHDEKQPTNKFDKNSNDEETKLVEMDLKLKKIEDSIIDDALKYTGAHEDARDSKEIQDIKDSVISRLAEAYSLEKMRQALREYRTSIAQQRKQLQESGKLDNGSFYEEKRVSVPRKEAINEEKERTAEADNRIKCTREGEDCDEQVYKHSADVLDEQSYWTRGDCPQIEMACNDVAEVLGIYGRTLEPACNMHQICLYCGENSWFAPTRQCNVLFLAKADELCDGDVECHKIANHSVRYLLDVYRSAQMEHKKECNLSCPNNRR